MIAEAVNGKVWLHETKVCTAEDPNGGKLAHCFDLLRIVDQVLNFGFAFPEKSYTPFKVKVIAKMIPLPRQQRWPPKPRSALIYPSAMSTWWKTAN